MDADVRDEDGIRIVSMRAGHVEQEGIQAFKQLLEHLVFSAPGDVILQIDEVGYLSSLALGLLSLAAVNADRAAKQLIIVCAREDLLKLFMVSGLSRVVKICNSLQSARDWLRGGPGSGNGVQDPP